MFSSFKDGFKPISEADWFNIILHFSPFYHYGQFILSATMIKDVKSDGELTLHIIYLVTFALIFYILAVWACKELIENC